MAKRYPFTKEPEVETSASEPPPIEAPPVEPVPPGPTADELLTKRLTDYVHHRLNQHLPSAVEFYVQELRDVIAGKTP